MKNMIIFCTFLSFISCASTGSNINNSVQSGWIDEDTYMVNVTGTDEETAIAQAKHQILKDIVEVRMRNNSRYTDIEKIREEFIIPCKMVLLSKNLSFPRAYKYIIKFTIRV